MGHGNKIPTIKVSDNPMRSIPRIVNGRKVREIGDNHYECRKCANRFEEPEKSKTYNICPLCKSRDIARILCAYCDFYKNRFIPCGKGHSVGVPFSIACWEWNIRSLNKPKVI